MDMHPSTLQTAQFGRNKVRRFLVAALSASILFGAVGAPVALADGSGSPPVGSAPRTGALPRAINYGYGNTIVTQVYTPFTHHKPGVFRPPGVPQGTLPFTGSQLSIFVIVGLALLLGGALLRMTGRREPRFAAETSGEGGTPAPSSDPLEMRRRAAIEAARLGGLTSGARDRPGGYFPDSPRH
jgi:LPXTG-motif cell wall-anchored protein